MTIHPHEIVRDVIRIELSETFKKVSETTLSQLHELSSEIEKKMKETEDPYFIKDCEKNLVSISKLIERITRLRGNMQKPPVPLSHTKDSA